MSSERNHPRAITELSRPLYRRIGRKVLRIDHDGISIRGKHKKKWHGPLTWATVFSMLEDPTPFDEIAGEKVLERIGAIGE